MTATSPLGRALDELRRDLDADATDPDTQLRYEAWARRDGWQVRDEAVALVVGVDPARWREFVRGSERAAWAEALTVALAHGLEVPADGSVSPVRVRSWAQAQGLRLPLALSRLLDFMAAVLAPAEEASPAAEEEILRAQEREVLLGAALMLVTKEQAACLDEDGCYSSSSIARLILSRAVLWFPLSPPTLGEAAIAALLERWIGRPG